MAPGRSASRRKRTDATVGILASVFHADGKHADALRVGIPARKSGYAMDPEVWPTTSIFPSWTAEPFSRWPSRACRKWPGSYWIKPACSWRTSIWSSPTRPTCASMKPSGTACSSRRKNLQQHPGIRQHHQRHDSHRAG